MSTQTLRTTDQLLAELLDNTARLISPEDVRDLCLSAFGAAYSFDPGFLDDVDNSAGNGFFDARSTWFNITSKILWVCFDGSHHAADWRQVYPSPPFPPFPVLDVSGIAPIDVSPTTGHVVVSHDLSTVSAGSYGDSTHYPTFTVDAWGHLTVAGQVAVPVLDVTGTAPIAVTPTTGNVVVSHDVSGVSAGSYGDSSHYATFTVDAWGHLTVAGQVAVPVLDVTGTAPITVTPTTGHPVVSHDLSSVAAGSYGDSTHWTTFTVDTRGHLTAAGTQALPTLLTSVALTMPADFMVSGSPVTPAGGTLAVAWANTTPGDYLRLPASSPTGPPTFGPIKVGDLPQGNTGSGTGGSVPGWVHKSYSFTDFATTGTSTTITVLAMEQFGSVDQIRIYVNAKFQGGLGTYTGGIGWSGGQGITPTNTSGWGTWTPGTLSDHPTNVAGPLPDCRSAISGYNVTITLSNTMGLNAMTSGDIDVWVLTSVME